MIGFSFAEASALDAEDRTALLGGKGAALANMTALGLAVPPGFVLATTTCNKVAADGWSPAIDDRIATGIADLEAATGRRFGAGPQPLLVSVRSGSPVSMPGMMDTVLNVGMTDEVAAALGAACSDDWFGWDTARRFVQSYATIVAGVSHDDMAAISSRCLGDHEGRDLAVPDLRAAVRSMRSQLAEAGCEIPTDPMRQVTEAVGAVFASWTSDRAQTYRQIEGISASLGTAATVQVMTFGNMGDRSGTGVAFTRDPSTGEQGLVGDFLVGAQGEDVVAGTHATLPIAQLRVRWPELAAELQVAAAQLERDLADMADIEFTVEDGKLWLLQVRAGKRSPRAALRIAIDLAEDPDIDLDRAGAVARVADILADPPTRPNPRSSSDHAGTVLASGLAASPGRASGRLRVGIDAAIEAEARGERVILVRRETSPADIAGMAAACGLITSLGGLVSHAAVIARSWGVPAVVGVADLQIMESGIVAGGRLLEEGEMLTIDGDEGVVLLGEHPADEVVVDEVEVLRRWQRDLVGAGSRVSAENPGDHVVVAASDVERVLGLKGFGNAEVVAGVLGAGMADVETIIEALVEAGDAQALPGGRVRLLSDAQVRVNEQFALAAADIGRAIEPVWEQFHVADARFKLIVTAWQMREVDGQRVPNDHDDASYDQWVIDRLRSETHPEISTIVGLVSVAVPRLSRYQLRFDRALDALAAGDPEMMAHPMRDSYHTVWFELHEELIRLTGRNRADEAAAGRG